MAPEILIYITVQKQILKPFSTLASASETKKKQQEKKEYQ